MRQYGITQLLTKFPPISINRSSNAAQYRIANNEMATNTSNTASSWKEVLTPTTGPNREEHGIFATHQLTTSSAMLTAWQSASITKGTTLLAKVEGVENPVSIHNPSTATGKRTIARIMKNEFFVLQGIGNPALVYRIDPEEVFKSSGELEAPDFRHFVKAQNTAELHEIHSGERGQGSIIKLTSAIPLLLGFTEAFLNDRNGQTATELILLVVDEILRSIEREPPVFEINLSAVDQKRVEEEDLVARGLRIVNWLHFYWKAMAFDAVTCKPVLEGSNTKEAADEMHRELLLGQTTLATTHDAATQQILETLLASMNNSHPRTTCRNWQRGSQK